MGVLQWNETSLLQCASSVMSVDCRVSFFHTGTSPREAQCVGHLDRAASAARQWWITTLWLFYIKLIMQINPAYLLFILTVLFLTYMSHSSTLCYATDEHRGRSWVSLCQLELCVELDFFVLCVSVCVLCVSVSHDAGHVGKWGTSATSLTGVWRAVS